MFNFILILFLLFPSTSFAWCKIYTVKKNDTYSNIAYYYFKEYYYRFYLEKYNQNKKLIPGEKIAFFIPEFNSDWMTGCRNLIISRMTEVKAHKQISQFIDNIPTGLLLAAKAAGLESLDPMLALDLCAHALAAAEVSTNYGRSKNKPNTLSVFGFQKDALKKVFDFLFLTEQFEKAGIPIEKGAEKISAAMLVFSIHFTFLWTEAKSNIFKTLIRYYGREKDLSLDGLTAFNTYLQIYLNKAYQCKLTDGENNE